MDVPPAWFTDAMARLDARLVDLHARVVDLDARVADLDARVAGLTRRSGDVEQAVREVKTGMDICQQGVWGWFIYTMVKGSLFAP
jgi:hypothetical protein